MHMAQDVSYRPCVHGSKEKFVHRCHCCQSKSKCSVINVGILLSVFINGAAWRMKEQTRAEHQVLLALLLPQAAAGRAWGSPPCLVQGTLGWRSTSALSCSFRRGLVLDASPTDLYDQRPSPVTYFINLCAWPRWQAYVCHVIEFVCLLSEDTPQACFLPHDSHSTLNFSLPPHSKFAWVVAGFLFKSSRSKRGEEDLRSMCGKVQYQFYLDKVGTRRCRTIGCCNRAKGQWLAATRLVKGFPSWSAPEQKRNPLLLYAALTF